MVAITIKLNVEITEWPLFLIEISKNVFLGMLGDNRIKLLCLQSMVSSTMS